MFSSGEIASTASTWFHIRDLCTTYIKAVTRAARYAVCLPHDEPTRMKTQVFDDPSRSA
jgi:hypothetical protein